MSETEVKPKEWAIDWKIEVKITLETVVTVSRSEIHEGASAEEASMNALRDAFIDASDIDLSMIDLNEIEIEQDDETFTVESISEWGTT